MLIQTRFFFSTNQVTQRYRYQAYRHTLQILRDGKEGTRTLYLREMRMQVFGRTLRVQYKTISSWLVKAAEKLPEGNPNTKACSFIRIYEI